MAGACEGHAGQMQGLLQATWGFWGLGVGVATVSGEVGVGALMGISSNFAWECTRCSSWEGEMQAVDGGGPQRVPELCFNMNIFGALAAGVVFSPPPWPSSKLL